MGAFVKFDPHTFLRNREKAVLESDFVAGVAGVAGVHVDFRKLAEEQNPTLEADPVKSVAGVASVAGEDEDFSPPPENGKLRCTPATIATTATNADSNTSNSNGAVFTALERLCPDYVDHDRWQQAVEDGRRFLTQWGKQVEALGWTSEELFGLHQPVPNSHPSYNRLSRYDCTGLVWLLCGNPVVAMTETTAAIQHSSGSVTVYRKHNKPPLGPLGDSLDDFV